MSINTNANIKNVRQSIGVEINILTNKHVRNTKSANESSLDPKDDTVLVFLAIIPSSTSVKADKE